MAKKINIDDDLFYKLKTLKELNNKSNTKEKLKLTTIINSLVSDYLKDKILSNTVLELDKTYYFNEKELLKNNETIASTEKPISNFNDYKSIKTIINNLDKFNNEFKTYCYNNKKIEHAGLEIYDNENYIFYLLNLEKELIKIAIVSNKYIDNITSNKEVIKELQTQSKAVKTFNKELETILKDIDYNLLSDIMKKL